MAFPQTARIARRIAVPLLAALLTLCLARASRRLSDPPVEPLLVEIRTGNVARVAHILETEPRLAWARGHFRRTPLHAAARHGRHDAIRLLLQSCAGDPKALGKILSELDGIGMTPLHLAAAGGHEKSAQLLLLARPAINSRDYLGMTPLHWAARSGALEIVKSLLANEASPRDRDTMGMTPLHWAARGGRAEVIRALMGHRAKSRGAGVGDRDLFGQTPLHWAVTDNHLPAIEAVLQVEEIARRALLSSTDRNGWTPLHVGAFVGRPDVVRLLIRYGADPAIKDLAGKSPSQIAEENGHQQVAKLLSANSRHLETAP